MFTVIVATHDSERPLVATLAALVPGATAGLVREVIVADGGSRDETQKVADIAGCRFISSDQPLGARLKAAAASARGEWLMFLDAGVVPEATWIDECAAFIGKGGAPKAAAFAGTGTIARIRGALNFLPRPEQGLLIAKSLYGELGGHRAEASEARADLLRRIGRRQLTTLRTAGAPSNS